MDDHLNEIRKEWHGTYRAYFIGFVGAALLTTASFFLVMSRLFTGTLLIYTLVGLGLVQAVVQLRFFLHLGHEEKPRWETRIFLFMVLVLLIIVLGTLWIMHNLNERVMNMDTM